MESVGVAEAFDEPKDQVASLWSVGKRLLFDELAFERGKERFAEGAVVAIANRTHRGRNPFGLALLSEGDGSVLEALIGGVNRPFWIALLSGHTQSISGHIQSVGDQSLQGTCHRPADDSTAEGIEHYRWAQMVLLGRNVGDVCHPEIIRLLGGEVSIGEVWSRASAFDLKSS